MVNADGSVSPCCASWNQQDDFGQIVPGVTSFDDIWNNDLYRAARSAFSGRDFTGHDQVGSLCTRCPFGDGIQHLYSIFDVKVMMRYFLTRREDDLVDRAFELLGRARYGRAFHAFLRRGKCFPIWLLWKRNGNEQAVSRFLEFYENNLAEKWSPTTGHKPVAQHNPIV